MMLYSALNEFQTSISKLKEHLVSIDNERKILDYLLTKNVPKEINECIEQIKGSRSDEKIYNYNANVISLYGYLERYIENVIKEYISNLTLIESDFSNLPDQVQKSYFDMIKSLHGKLSYPKYNHFKEIDLVNSLYNSLSKNRVSIIAEAFFKNGGNYRYDIIKDCINSLGLTDFNLLYKYPDLYNYYSYRQNKDIEHTETSSMFTLLNDLVDRRNDIAHGENSDELLTPEIFRDYIDFTEIVVNSINQYLEDALLTLVWDKTHSIEFKPYHCFGANKVIAVNKEALSFKKGGKLLCASPHGVYPKYIQTDIKSIEVNREEVDSFTINQPGEIVCLNIGLKLTSKWRIKMINM